MPEAKSAGTEAASSGVEQLIARLRDEGVKAGKAEAGAIVEKATTEAETILSEAKAKATQIVDDARQESEQLEAAGKEALRMATRDTILRFQEELMDYFNERVRVLVSEELEDRKTLASLILTVAGKTSRESGVADAKEIELLLPAQVLSVEELKRQPKQVRAKLTQFVKGVAQGTWREGVTFKALHPDAKGIRVHVEGKDLEVDLTAKAVSDILLEHMQPRFRALMQGIIQ